jgi:hypothetical protein
MEAGLNQKAEIISEKDYILVITPAGLDFWEIILAVGRLFSMREFQLKNDIWVFHEGPVDFLNEDLFRLKEFVKNNCPANAKGAKTAIVAGTHMQCKLAQSYANISRDLPHRIKVFTDFKSAEDWIRKKIRYQWHRLSLGPRNLRPLQW